MTLRSSAVRLLLLLGAIVPVALANTSAQPSHTPLPKTVELAPTVFPVEDAPVAPVACCYHSCDAGAETSPVVDEANAADANEINVDAIARLTAEHFCPALSLCRLCPDYNPMTVVEAIKPWAAQAFTGCQQWVAENTPKARFVPIATVPASAPVADSQCPLRGLLPAMQCVEAKKSERCARLIAEEFCPALALARACPKFDQDLTELTRPCVDFTVNAGQKILADYLARLNDKPTMGSTEEATEEPALDEPTDEKEPVPPSYPDSSTNCRLPKVDIFARDNEENATSEELAAPAEETPAANAPADEQPTDVCPHCPAGTQCPASSQDMTCPYLQKQKEAENCPKPKAAAAPGDLLENLEKLTKARELMDQCTQALADKDFAKARECCESVEKLCPGSRYAIEAATCREELARAPEVTPAVESQLCYPNDCGEYHDSSKEAKHALKKADHYRLKGEFAKAEKWYRKVEELCPESKMAHRAAAELHLIASLKAEHATEESESSPASEPQPKVVVPSKEEAQETPEESYQIELAPLPTPHEAIVSVEQRCAEAVEAGQRYLADGKLDEAEQAAHTALSLDCECVPAAVLLQEVYAYRERACDAGCHTDRGGEESAPTKDEKDEPETSLKHPLPAVDPKIVEAMEAIEEAEAPAVKPCVESEPKPAKPAVVDDDPENSEPEPAASAEEQEFVQAAAKWSLEMVFGNPRNMDGSTEMGAWLTWDEQDTNLVVNLAPFFVQMKIPVSKIVAGDR